MQPAIPNPNTVPVLPAAVSSICGYPLLTVQKGQAQGIYQKYISNWTFFNQVWAYNYTISTLNGQGARLSPWQFTTINDRVRFLAGQTAHAAAYPNSAGVFANPT